MKRKLLFLFVLILSVMLSACRGSNDNSSLNNSQSENLSTESETQLESEVPSESETSSESEVPPVSEIPLESEVPSESEVPPVSETPPSDTPKHYSPKVIASQCAHNYLPPTCVSLMPCTICGELYQGLYEGAQVGYGHYYNGNKCVNCGFERNGSLELSGNFFAVNQPITIDIRVMTTEKEIEIYPCITLYKEVNGAWVPYEGLYDVGEFFALEATVGEVLVENGVRYGRWDYMSNTILKTNPNAFVETEFAESRLIRRFKITIPESGTFCVKITDGPNDSLKNPDKNYDYIINCY